MYRKRTNEIHNKAKPVKDNSLLHKLYIFPASVSGVYYIIEYFVMHRKRTDYILSKLVCLPKPVKDTSLLFKLSILNKLQICNVL
jgi:hypothetical protein